MNLCTLILQTVYPSLCRQCFVLVCPTDVFCDPCLATIKPVVTTFFPITKNTTLKVYAVANYVQPMRSLITRKFTGDIRASGQLADMINVFVPLKNQPIDALVPVPLHWTRYASRGYNQANVIAQRLGKILHVPVVRAVRRTHKTKFQWQLSADMRRDNVKQAFDVAWWYRHKKLNFLEGKHIVIVDDLCTTGSTLVAVAKVLAAAKPASLTAVVGCRAV